MSFETTKKTEERKGEFGDFFEQKMFRDFARGDGGVEILSAQEAGVDVQVKTAGIDLEKRKLYFNESFMEKLDSSERAFVVLHEGGHLKKLLELLDTPNGQNLYKSWNKEISEKRRYGLLDNCVADAGINKDVIDYAPVAGKTEEGLYENHLFKIEDDGDILDMSSAPKHIQFSQTFQYERTGTRRTAKIAEEVRGKIDELKGQKNSQGLSLYDYLTSSDIPEDIRIKLQRKYLYPIVDELFEEDLEEQKQNKGKNKSSEGDKGESSEGEDSKNENEKQSGEEGGKAETGQGEEEREGDDKEANPEDMFKEYYDELEKENPQIINKEEVEKAIEEYIKKGGKGAEKTDQEILDEAMAKEGGVSAKDLQKYRNFWQQVEKIKNPETQESVVEELREVFQRIVNDKKEKRYVPKYPVEEGELLAFPAEAVVAVRRGEHEPKVWESIEQKERPKERYGDFDVTVVSDRSGSMGSVEIAEQRKAVALILESLAEFSEFLADERSDLEYNLNVRTEAWSFGDEKQVEVLKPLSEELTEKQRVNVYKKLEDASGGSTNDFSVLEKILDSVNEEDLKKIEDKKMKKIIIITSDGGSSDSRRLQNVLKDLREKGIIIAAIGITGSGKPVEMQYAPDGQVCEDSSQLANVLADLLKEHLTDL